MLHYKDLTDTETNLVDNVVMKASNL